MATSLDVEGLLPMTKNGYQNRIELVQGTLDMLILKTLQWGEQHGYGISQAIRATSGQALQVETGSLYPALHRLEYKGWISSDWGSSENNRRAKYYALTVAGREQLETELETWKRLSAAIGLVLSREASS